MTTLSLPTETDTCKLGAAIAKRSRVGDVITLAGPLGAGKTVLARGFVTSLVKGSIDVASPTFTLVNVYDTITPAVWHFDLYRVDSPDDIEELGLDEALASGISLIEWPDRATGWLPEDRLHIDLSTQRDTPHRLATIQAGPSWQSRLSAVTSSMENT